MQINAVTNALLIAWFQRPSAPGLIYHLERGSQGGVNRSPYTFKYGGVYRTT